MTVVKSLRSVSSSFIFQTASTTASVSKPLEFFITRILKRCDFIGIHDVTRDRVAEGAGVLHLSFHPFLTKGHGPSGLTRSTGIWLARKCICEAEVTRERRESSYHAWYAPQRTYFQTRILFELEARSINGGKSTFLSRREILKKRPKSPHIKTGNTPKRPWRFEPAAWRWLGT